MFEVEPVTVTNTETVPASVNSVKIKRFQELFKKFWAGMDWINRGYMARGWHDGYRTEDPTFERDIKDFELKIVKPMDQAWTELTEAERAAAMRKEP